MSGFGYTVLGFGSHPSRGPPALSISLAQTTPDGAFFRIVGEAGVSVTSTAGDPNGLVLTATAAGGDGSYSFQWTITSNDGSLGELDDEGTCAQTTAGTLDAANGIYNTARFTATIPDPGQGPPEATANYRYKCEVTDGNGDKANANIEFPVVATVEL